MFDKIVNAVLVVVALFLLGSYIGNRPPAPPDAVAEVEGWREAVAAGGIQIGTTPVGTADVVLVEFVDFQCPFCAKAVSQVDSLREKYGDRLALVVMHLPLGFHESALPAAIASECADRQGRFEEFYRLAFEQQDSLGVKPWVRYAEESGVTDTEAFEACASLPADSFPRIAWGQEFASQSGVTGTPTFWINQWRVPAGPQLEDRVEAVLAGKKP